MQLLNTKSQQLQWRRDRVLELSSQGHTQSDIASLLQVDKTLICKDVAYLKRLAQENLRRHLEEDLPAEYQKCMVGMKRNLKRVLEIADNAADPRLKLQASSVANECYRDIMELCTNAGIISDSLHYVEKRKLSQQLTDAEIKEVAAKTANEIAAATIAAEGNGPSASGENKASEEEEEDAANARVF